MLLLTSSCSGAGGANSLFCSPGEAAAPLNGDSCLRSTWVTDSSINTHKINRVSTVNLLQRRWEFLWGYLYLKKTQWLMTKQLFSIQVKISSFWLKLANCTLYIDSSSLTFNTSLGFPATLYLSPWTAHIMEEVQTWVSMHVYQV